MTFHEVFRNLRAGDLLDMAFVAGFIYMILLWFKRTKAAFVARGIVILLILYVFARQMRMVLTTWIFHGFFAIFLITLVVIFQEELRHFFERLAVWRWRRSGITPTHPAYVEDLIRSVQLFAKEHIGALVVIRGRDPLDRHLEGGHELDGKISSPLIESLFDPHSDGHDGAVVIEGNRITRFAVHLPLSKETHPLSGSGTRHAAALGLAERSDALCVVVSEQKGMISIARDARLFEVSEPSGLEKEIDGFLRSKTTTEESGPWSRILLQHLTEKVIAALFAVLLWLVFVKGFAPLHNVVHVDIPLARGK